MNGVTEAFWEVDPARDTCWWSEGMATLIGAPVDEPPSLRGLTDRLVRRAVRPGEADPHPLSGDFEVRLPDGRQRWLRGRVGARAGSDGPTRQGGVLLDITEERAVRHQTERLAAVASRTQNGVVVTDADGHIIWVNDGFTRITGYAAEEVIGQRPGAVLQGPDTDPECRARMAAAIATGRPFDEVVLNYAKEGRQYWVRIEAQPDVDPSGAITGYLAIEADVTEQRIHEARESLMRRVAALLIGAPSLPEVAPRLVRELVGELDIRVAQLWTVDPARPTLVYITGACAEPRGQEWLDVSRDLPFRKGTDWIVGVGAPGTAWGTGRPYTRTDFWSQDSHGQLSRRAVAAKKAGFRTICTVPIRGPDGVLGVIEVGGSHRFPGHDRLSTLLERVAEQIASFLQRDEHRAAFETVFRHSPDPLLLVDGKGYVLAANAEGIRLFGPCEGGAANALVENTLDLVADALYDANRVQEGRTAALKRRAWRPDGTEFWADVTVAAAPSSTHQRVILAVRDLTERYAMEDALKQSLAEKVTLIQEVHHRVKNNLQIISSLVAMQADEIQQPEIRSALLETVHRVRSMALAHQALYANQDLSRIEFGEYASALAQMLCGSLERQAQLTFDLATVPLTLERAVPCGLILNELITNAIKHGRSADGLARVSLQVASTPDGFAFSVRDQGPGWKRTPGVRSGVSIGQDLVEALVHQLRATMTVTVDGGTTVRIDVPETPDFNAPTAAASRR